MTLSYYQLKEPPFGAIPDTRFLFVNSAHRQALGSILMALREGNSAVSLIGQTGLGKTTLLFHMFKTFEENVTTVYLFQPPQTPIDLLRAILADLGVREMNEFPQEMLNLLKDLLLDQVQQQKRVVVIIDEAQNLEPSVLELLWMLSNPAGPHGHLLQFVLSGQASMAETVAEPESAQLTYRLPIVARLEPLSQEDTALYIDHRLRIAGFDGDEPLFAPEANALIARYSDGVPRKINNLCFSSLSLGYKTKQRRIEAHTVRAVIADLGLDRLQQRVLGPAQATEPILPELPATVAFALPVQATAAPAKLRERPPVRIARPRQVVLSQATRSMARLAPKLGLAAAVLLTVAVTLVNLRHHALTPVSGTPPSAVFSSRPSSVLATLPAPATRVASPPETEHDLKGMDVQSAVRALHRRSLHDLCKANFGQCDSKQLQEMQKVNLRSKASAHAKARRASAPRNVSQAAATDQALASSN